MIVSMVPNIIKEIAEFELNETKQNEGSDEDFLLSKEYEKKLKKEIRLDELKNYLFMAFIGFSAFHFASTIIAVILSLKPFRVEGGQPQDIMFASAFICVFLFLLSIPICYIAHLLNKTDQLYIKKTIKIPVKDAIDFGITTKNDINEYRVTDLLTAPDYQLFNNYINDFITSPEVRLNYRRLLWGHLQLVKKPRSKLYIDRAKKELFIICKTYDPNNTDTYEKKITFMVKNENEYNNLIEYLESNYSCDLDELLMRVIEEEIDKLKSSLTHK